MIQLWSKAFMCLTRTIFSKPKKSTLMRKLKSTISSFRLRPKMKSLRRKSAIFFKTASFQSLRSALKRFKSMCLWWSLTKFARFMQGGWKKKTARLLFSFISWMSLSWCIRTWSLVLRRQETEIKTLSSLQRLSRAASKEFSC